MIVRIFLKCVPSFVSLIVPTPTPNVSHFAEHMHDKGSRCLCVNARKRKCEMSNVTNIIFSKCRIREGRMLSFYNFNGHI